MEKRRKTNGIRFVLIAIFVAVIFIFGSNLEVVLRNVVYTYVPVDKAYYWIANMTIGLVFAFVVSNFKGTRKITLLLVFLTVTIGAECVIWHRPEVLKLLVKNTIDREKIFTEVIFLIKAVICFYIYTKVPDFFSTKEYKEKNKEDTSK